jgi:retron-type reverse transcriptase
MTHDAGKSDRPVVPTKHPNKATTVAAEDVEGRGLAKGNTDEQNAVRTLRRETAAPSALARVRERARRDKKARFTALLHHVTVDRLRTAFEQLRKNAAAGVDGVTWSQYGEHLDEKLHELHARLHRGAYRAKPSRRVYIPKADGRQRPLGVASLEDKLVQRAVVEVMNAVYEQDFLGFSYGFRPGRGQHDALDALAAAIVGKKVNWLLDADIRGFFDAIDHGWLVKFIEHRIGDRRLVRLIQKWLTAGVMENGQWTASTVGSPQGATASPLLANIYMHYVLDQSSTCGSSSGGGGMRAATWSSCATQTTSSWASSTRKRQGGSSTSCENDCAALRWNYTPTRRVSLSSAAPRRRSEPREVSVARRIPSASSGCSTSAAGPARAGSC